MSIPARLDHTGAITTIIEPSAAVDTDELSAVISAIYDAAVTPDHWSNVLDTARRFIGGMSGTIFAKDARSTKSGIFHIDDNLDLDYGKSYFDRYEKADPGDGWTRLPGIDQPAGLMDLLDADEMTGSRFYREWARPAGIVDLVMTPLERSGGITALFGVFMHERDGMVGSAVKRRMHLLSPHVRRAMSIGRVAAQQAQQTTSLSDAFDGLAAGLFLIDADGRVVHTNKAARAMLGDGVLSLRDERVVVADRDTRRALADAFTATADRDSAMDQGGISLTLRGEDADYVAHILPLTSGARAEAGGHYAAVTAMFVQPVSRDLPLDDGMARAFGLTPAEQRVLSVIANVGGVPESASTLGVAESTVKTHLQRLFDKTGTSRQADLVKLLAGYASPLAR
jgi:DNA-binding CsgD family transcriptional regulator/PAS domain-containing protein